jgi:Mn2+/Fe2+ NRAMP family transporter
MLSTSLTVVDGFPRGIARSIEVLAGRRAAATPTDRREIGGLYWAAMAAIGVATPLLLALFVGSLTGMVDFATTVTFLTAPILGYLNLRAVLSNDVAPEHRPGAALRWLSWSALLVLAAFGILYLITLIR